MNADPSHFEHATEPPPEGFEERLLARLRSDADARDEAAVERIGAHLAPTPPASAPRARRGVLREPVTWLFGLAAAAVAAAITFFATYAPPRGDETPFSFVRPGVTAPQPLAQIHYDARGRLSEILPPGGDGEHIVFRAGRVVRIERLRGGQRHGAAVDLDADGGVIRLETWQDGKRAGPWLTLDGHGAVLQAGSH